MISITLYCDPDADILISRLMLDDGMPIVVYLDDKVIRTVNDDSDLDELIAFANSYAESK